MTIATFESFREYPETIDERGVQKATARWEEKSGPYAGEQRSKTIGKIAIGIIGTWAALIGTVIVAVETNDEVSTLFIVLSSVFGCMTPILTCALWNLGNNLRTYKPYKYDLDNPKTVFKIRNLLVNGSIQQVSYELEGYCDHLKKAGIFTPEGKKEVKKYITRHIKLSSNRGLFHISHSPEEIAKSEKLQQRVATFREVEIQLKSEWEVYQTDHLPNNLPQPVVQPMECTPLNQTVIQYV